MTERGRSGSSKRSGRPFALRGSSRARSSSRWPSGSRLGRRACTRSIRNRPFGRSPAWPSAPPRRSGYHPHRPARCARRRCVRAADRLETRHVHRHRLAGACDPHPRGQVPSHEGPGALRFVPRGVPVYRGRPRHRARKHLAVAPAGPRPVEVQPGARLTGRLSWRHAHIRGRPRRRFRRAGTVEPAVQGARRPGRHHAHRPRRRVRLRLLEAGRDVRQAGARGASASTTATSPRRTFVSVRRRSRRSIRSGGG